VAIFSEKKLQTKKKKQQTNKKTEPIKVLLKRKKNTKMTRHICQMPPLLSQPTHGYITFFFYETYEVN